MERGCKCVLSKHLSSAAVAESRLPESTRTSLFLPLQASLGISETPIHVLPQSFIILIYCQYTDDPEDVMHLKAPLFDFDLMMRYIRSIITAAQCQVYVLTDLPAPKSEPWFQYKKIDHTNARTEILATVQEATQLYISGTVFYGGHGARDGGGAYLYPQPGNKIYGKDIVNVLTLRPDTTVGFILDACYIGTFFDATTVPCLLETEDGVVARSGGRGAPTGGQLIVISATRDDQKARVICLEPAMPVVCSHGVLLACLIDHIREHQAEGIDLSDLITDLQPPKSQNPLIASRRPLASGHFLHLPIFHL